MTKTDRSGRPQILTAAGVNREHKSTLFARIFSEPEAALELYNALNRSHYDDPAALRFNTIGSFLYMGMKNDVSFIVGSDLNLYEHQSTRCPNMPLRGLFYLSALYQGYVSENGLDLYSSVLLRLPRPKYMVFYNGTGDEPEEQTLRLSDAFMGPDQDGAPALECTARVLNINSGHNRELMERSRKLYEYAYLIGAIRTGLAEGKTLRAATDTAVKDCIDQGILRDFLLKHQAEVTNMILEEFDLEQHLRNEEKIHFERGRNEEILKNRRHLIRRVCRKLQKGRTPEQIADELEEAPELILPICEAAAAFAPEYDCDRVFDALQK